jgi:hypothetical protein
VEEERGRRPGGDALLVREVLGEARIRRRAEQVLDRPLCENGAVIDITG